MVEELELGWSEARRLKVFAALTEPQEESRLLSAYCEAYEIWRGFGPLCCFEERDQGEVVAQFYDLRHARSAYEYFRPQVAVSYLPDESNDTVYLPLRDYLANPSIDALLPSFGDLITTRHTGLFSYYQYFDLRSARLAASELTRIGMAPLLSTISKGDPSDCSLSPGLDNAFAGVQIQYSDLDVSIGSERTLASWHVGQYSSSYSGNSASPYVESPSEDGTGQRRKPKKKPMDEKDKALYELSIPRILDGSDTRTTVMVKNIPNKYTQKMLLSSIDKHFSATYDFFYLPIDFKNKCNVGYAFVNFIDPLTIPAFYSEKNGKKWEHFKSEKICAIAYARIQGKSALLLHFQSSSVMSQEDQKVKPLVF